MAEEGERRRRIMVEEEMLKIMEEISKDMGKMWNLMGEMSKITTGEEMSNDMGKLSKITEEMSKDMGKMSKIMGEISKITTGEMSSSTTTTTTTSTSTLPIMEILSWVPAKSLVDSFKFVCKEWRALILDPHFVKMHLNRRRGAEGSAEGSGLICKSGNVVFQLHPPFNFEGLPPTIAPTRLVADFGPLLCSDFRLVGSCNGLISSSINEDQRIIILNPSTRKYKISPEQPIQHHLKIYNAGVTYGFGCCYNSTNKVDEYKVVRIVALEDAHSVIAQYDIYSMSSNSWRRESGFFRDSRVFIGQLGVFLNGALHWMGASVEGVEAIEGEFRHVLCNRIVSFDIRDEEFRHVPIPVSFDDPSEPTNDDDDDPIEKILLMNMRGCLAMIRSSDVYKTMDVNLEVWVMKEYGMKESWTKEFVIRSSDSDPPRALSEFSLSTCPTAYVLKGDQILIEGSRFVLRGSLSPSVEGYRKLVLYGINEGRIDGKFKMIGVPDDPNMFQVDYIETLVSLKSLLLPLSNN